MTNDWICEINIYYYYIIDAVATAAANLTTTTTTTLAINWCNNEHIEIDNFEINLINKPVGIIEKIDINFGCKKYIHELKKINKK